MKINFLKIIPTVVAVGCFVIINTSSAQNTDQNSYVRPPMIYIDDLNITEIKDGKISGSFTAINKENYYMPDIKYDIMLYRGADFDSMKFIDVKLMEEILIPPGEKTLKNFSYIYPKNIINGDYILIIELISDRGQLFGWQMQKISLTGKNKFLDILDTHTRVISGKQEGYPMDGINVASTDDVYTFFKVKNTSEAITVVPHVKIFQRHITMPVVSEYDDAPITIAKNETKDIKILMPKFEKPESYLAIIDLRQNGVVFSGIQYARWVVEGEGGKILSVKSKSDNFDAGNAIIVLVETIGPADMTDIGLGRIDVFVSDRDGNFLGSSSTNIELNSYAIHTKISIPIKKDVIEPIIGVKLSKNEKLLDERTIKLAVYSNVGKKMLQNIEKEKTNQENRKKIITYVSYFSSFIIILVLIFFAYKFHKKYGE